MANPYESMPKVVHVINKFRLAINRGSENDVKVGDQYLVFQLGENISDPDTGEDLGQLEIVRGRARVVHVQDRIATLESDEVTRIPGQKRKIKRQGGSGVFAFYNLPSTEEIEEGGETEMSSLGAEIGDIARPI